MRYVEPISQTREMEVAIERGSSPSAFVNYVDTGEPICIIGLSLTDDIQAADLLRHLVECHNKCMREKTRPRKSTNP